MLQCTGGGRCRRGDLRSAVHGAGLEDHSASGDRPLDSDRPEQIILDELSSQDNTEVAVEGRVEVARAPAWRASFRSDLAGVDYSFERFFLVEGSRTLTVTFNRGTSPDAECKTVVESVLATWAWD